VLIIHILIFKTSMGNEIYECFCKNCIYFKNPSSMKYGYGHTDIGYNTDIDTSTPLII